MTDDFCSLQMATLSLPKSRLLNWNKKGDLVFSPFFSPFRFPEASASISSFLRFLPSEDLDVDARARAGSALLHGLSVSHYMGGDGEPETNMET